VAELTAATRIDCGPLRARMSARQCAINSTRRSPRVLGCIGCALGAEVRAALGVTEAEADGSGGWRASRMEYGRALRQLPVVDAPLTAHQVAVRRALARDRTACAAAEVAEAQRLFAALVEREGTQGAVLTRLELGRTTAWRLSQGRCTRGVLDVLRGASAGVAA
jgi:hypothetical protein